MPQLRITKQITRRDSPAAERYLLDVKKIPLLSVEEEIELARRIQHHDTKAEHKLILANLRFVISVAKYNEPTACPSAWFLEKHCSCKVNQTFCN